MYTMSSVDPYMNLLQELNNRSKPLVEIDEKINHYLISRNNFTVQNSDMAEE
jgi:hypothetical protein